MTDPTVGSAGADVPADVAVAVIGRGMVGSAAARHLAEAGVSVAVIGAGEPADYATAAGPFASHYDSGRITRISDAHPIWSELAARSIARYRDIADRSGIEFHQSRGLAQTSLSADDCVANAVARGGDARRVDRDWLRAATGISVRPDHPGGTFYEEPPAGLIDPRRLVAAQCALAAAAGAVVVETPARAVQRLGDGFRIECGATSITADRIILATGAYGARLVGVELATEPRLRTVVMADMGPGEAIPSYIDTDPGHPDLDSIYWVPPVEYPDGRVMLKIGGDMPTAPIVEREDEITAWFHAGGSTVEADALQQVLRSLLPEADFRAWDHKPCVITYTVTGLPYIDTIDDGVVAALGACGAGAKSSDEIGRLAADLARNGWVDDTLHAADFAAVEN